MKSKRVVGSAARATLLKEKAPALHRKGRRIFRVHRWVTCVAVSGCDARFTHSIMAFVPVRKGIDRALSSNQHSPPKMAATNAQSTQQNTYLVDATPSHLVVHHAALVEDVGISALEQLHSSIKVAQRPHGVSHRGACLPSALPAVRLEWVGLQYNIVRHDTVSSSE